MIVIGAGQAGLSVGYYLARRGLSFVILDANERIGDSWRKRWDSLRLFTPARYDGLDGMPFPAPRHSFPTKDADGRLSRGVRCAVSAAGAKRRQGRAALGENRVATSPGQTASSSRRITWSWRWRTIQSDACRRLLGISTPTSCSSIRASIKARRSFEKGPCSIVGAGNSGAEIALELAALTAHCCRAGTRRSHSLSYRRFLGAAFSREFGAARRVSPLDESDESDGSKMRVKMLTQGGPLVRVKPQDLLTAGVERVGRVTRSQRRASRAGRRQCARRRERHLVYGLRFGLVVDRPADFRRVWRASARRRACQGRTGVVLRRAAVPLCCVVSDGSRSRSRRSAHCRDNRHALRRPASLTRIRGRAASR